MAKKRSKPNPWRGFEGYFIMPDGNSVEVSDHFDAIKEHPTFYGFTDAEVARYPRAQREALLQESLRRGVIRVRGHYEYATFEFYKMDPVVMRLIKTFISRRAFHQDEKISLHEISTHKAWEGPYVQLKNLGEADFHERKG